MSNAKVAPVEADESKQRDRTSSMESLDDPFEILSDPKDDPEMYEKPEYIAAKASEMVPTKTLVRLFCEEPHSSKHATYFHGFYSIIIVASVAAYCTETLNLSGGANGNNNLTVAQYKSLEIVFTIIFTLDIFIRSLVAKQLCCCSGSKTKTSSSTKKLRGTPFFLNIGVIFDIMSVLPYPVGEIIDVSGVGVKIPSLASSVRVLSLCRILRVFKVTRNFDGAKVLFVTIRNSLKPLTVSFIVLISVMVIVSAALFFFEPCYATDCIYTDQMNGAYFLVITLTTIGYGDQIPTSTPGKIIAMLIAFLGSFYMAMPLAIIGSKFDEAYKERELALAQRGAGRSADQLKEALSHVSSQERRDRVIRLGFKITEVLENSIHASDTESKFYMKAFPKKADILCNDISILFEVALRGTNLDQAQRQLKRTESIIAAEKKHKTKRKNTVDGIRDHMMFQIAEAEKARNSKSCRDKTWLVMNEHGTNTSSSSKYFRNIQMIVIGLSIGMVVVETLPEMNKYGPTTRICKQVVSYYCTHYVDSTNLAHVQANPGCFPFDVEVNGKTVNYKGCIVEGDAYETDCDFPNAEAAMTCVSQVNQTQETLVTSAYNYYQTAIITKEHGMIYSESDSANAKTMSASTGITLKTKKKLGGLEPNAVVQSVALNEAVAAFDPNFSDWHDLGVIKSPITNICDRTQCRDNHNNDKNYPFVFFLVECLFICVFTLEMLVRIVVMRSCKRFWWNYTNIIDVFASCTALAEIIWIPLAWGKPAYEVWGMGKSMDPAIFRVMRILVAVRFISLQKQTGGLSVITETIKKTWDKLVIPIVFFVLFAILFAGIFYTFESGSLFQCPAELSAQLNDGFVHRKFVDRGYEQDGVKTNLGQCYGCLPKLPVGETHETLKSEAGGYQVSVLSDTNAN